MDQDMQLPPGKTCGDCVHLRRCVTFGFTKILSTHCDFAPSRFLDVQTMAEKLELLKAKEATHA